MKLDAARIDHFLKSPTTTLALIYGPDSGLVAERGRALAASLPGAAADPFRFAELHSPDPGTFLNEATAAALTGGRRLIRVREAGEALAKPLESLIANPPDALVILEAGDLTPKSKLRALAEKSPAIAAIPCYALDAARLPATIIARLRAEGVSIEPDAATLAAASSPAEAGPLAQTIELLTLYAGAAKHLTREDIAAILPDNGDASIGDAIDATLQGDLAGTDRALTLAYDEGQSPVGIIRMLLGELMRLRLAAGAIANGASTSEAIAAIRPPVFFKRQPTMAKILALWPLPALDSALAAALRAETACKTTLIPDQAFCRQTMLALATRARSAARK